MNSSACLKVAVMEASFGLLIFFLVTVIPHLAVKEFSWHDVLLPIFFSSLLSNDYSAPLLSSSHLSCFIVILLISYPIQNLNLTRGRGMSSEG